MKPEELSPEVFKSSRSLGLYSDLLGMPDGHFQYELWWDFKELWIIAIGLEEQRQDIEAPIRCLPPLLNADLQAKQRWGYKAQQGSCSSSVMGRESQDTEQGLLTPLLEVNNRFHPREL